MSWLSRKVTERLGHHPSSPGALPPPSFIRQYSVFLTASCMHGSHVCPHVRTCASRRQDWSPWRDLASVRWAVWLPPMFHKLRIPRR